VLFTKYVYKRCPREDFFGNGDSVGISFFMVGLKLVRIKVAYNTLRSNYFLKNVNLCLDERHLAVLK